MNYSDYVDIYNQFQEMQKQINELNERIDKNLFLPCITFALCCITISLSVATLVCLGIFYFKIYKKDDK